MPQLDKFSFFVQIFWLFVIFLISFVFLRYEILPGILYSLRLRQKSLDNLYNNINNIVIEKYVFNDFLKKFISRKRLKSVNNFFKDFDRDFFKYFNKSVKNKIR